MAVPDNNAFNLQNVVDEINPATDDLVACFAAANAAGFDPAYSGSKNSLLNFRNYHTPTSELFTLELNSMWEIPAGITRLTVECYGNGGAGAGKTALQTGWGGGGAGGQYAIATFNVAAGNSLRLSVYTGRIGTTAANLDGLDTKVELYTDAYTTKVLAKGGQGGNVASGGVGSLTGGIGDTVRKGGNGGTGTGTWTGAGGGGAGPTSDGSNAINPTGGAGAGGYAGTGGASVAGDANGHGLTGNDFGGGGSGASRLDGIARNGGAGAGGLIIITY